MSVIKASKYNINWKRVKITNQIQVTWDCLMKKAVEENLQLYYLVNKATEKLLNEIRNFE